MEGNLIYEKIINTLNMDVQRERFFVIRWIEERLAKDQDNEKELIEEVTVRLTEEFSYKVSSGIVQNVILFSEINDFFMEKDKPTVDELKLLEASMPKMFAWLSRLCVEIREAFDHPHSCSIDYHPREAVCSGQGCGRIGFVNYKDSETNWQFFCGRSPRCCP